MLENKNLKKVIALILVFIMTFGNFAFVSKSYASSWTESLFGSNASKSIEFNTYFETEEGNSTSVISDVNNEDLAIQIDLSIENVGYLKDAKIVLKELNEGAGINFKLKNQESFNYEEHVEGINDNTLILKHIKGFEKPTRITIPIEYKNEEYVNEGNLDKAFIVELSGTYVDDDGNETEIVKETKLELIWTDNREIRLETEATQFIDCGAGVIFQTIIRLDNSTNKNSLPIQKTELLINPPLYNEKAPSKVFVVANSTVGTNGEIASNVSFNESNWNYNQEENTLKMLVNNNKQLVQVDEYKDEYLQEENKEIIEEERYYNGSGIDEYLITYTYNDARLSDEEILLNSLIEARNTILSGKESIITRKNEFEYKLNGRTGDIVSLNIDNKDSEISKAYSYVNYENSEQYEVEMASETIINVSYKDIVNKIEIEDIENVYIDKSGNAIPNTDIYYKKISVSKENFNKILGENGEIKVLNIDGTQLTVINNSSETDEKGNIVIAIDAKISKIKLEITRPVSEGNLVISNTKAMKNASIDKQTMANIAEMSAKMLIRAEYDYVDGLVDIETEQTNIKLNDVTTNATLKLDTEKLATLEDNKDVELRVELNNNTDKSDVYGNSVFEIQLPEAVESYEVTGSSIIYGEGLEISNVQTEGKTIRVTVEGKQNQISAGNITNGTNIILNTNMKLDIYTPLKEDNIKLCYSNDNATNYENEGISEAVVSYSAPTGVVAVNSISNYDNSGAILTSVKQGYQEGKLSILSEARIATTDLVIMNNNTNSVSNISILGRVPFEGVKDLLTDTNLGTTVNSPLVSLINSNNNTEFKVYYSENGNANKDLNDTNNGWLENPENLDTIKSYLIVPVDENYEMKPAETLRFSYNHRIPENLSRNKSIYGTYVVNYNSNEDGTVVEEQSAPDIVGLTTGEGPEVSLVVSSDITKVKEAEEFYVTMALSNVGRVLAKSINLEFPIPDNTTYVSSRTDKSELIPNLENNILKINIPEMKVDENIEVVVYLKVNSINNEIENVKITPSATLTAEEIEVPIEDKANEILIEHAEFELIERNRLSNDENTSNFIVGDTVVFDTEVINISSEKKTNVIVTRELSQEYKYLEAYIIRKVQNESGMSFEEDKASCQYDDVTKVLTAKVGDMEPNSNVQIRIRAQINDFPVADITRKEVTTSFTAKADGTEEYESNKVVSIIGKPQLEIEQTTDVLDSYIKVGDRINYLFTVKNTGSAKARNVILEDHVPEGLIVEKITYTVGTSVNEKYISNNKNVSVTTDIEPGEQINVNVDAIAGNLVGVQERTVTNSATVSADKAGEKTSGQITHIIESSETNLEDSNAMSSSTATSIDRSNISQTYRIEGTAWEDENKDGARNNNEKLLSGISVKLVDSESGIIKKSVITDSSGNYKFSGIEKGNYLVIFDYDTVQYTVTAYRKEGVASNVNSDAITTKLEQGGKLRNGAISDVININNGSVSGIDIGLVPADRFDLSLTKTITKVTIQTSKGLETEDINSETLVKREIAAKNLSGSTVTVEYTITVKNEGDVKGYVKKIVDYIPEGMTFNSSHNANKEWYTGSDGNLYSTSLSNKELKPGDSATIKLVLTKQMTEDNTGLSKNNAEIAEDYNIYGISDMNSTPNNEVQGENDLGSADLFILVKTGETLIYVSVISITVILAVVVIFIIHKELIYRRKIKGGV